MACTDTVNFVVNDKVNQNTLIIQSKEKISFPCTCKKYRWFRHMLSFRVSCINILTLILRQRACSIPTQIQLAVPRSWGVGGRGGVITYHAAWGTKQPHNPSCCPISPPSFSGVIVFELALASRRNTRSCMRTLRWVQHPTLKSSWLPYLIWLT